MPSLTFCCFKPFPLSPRNSLPALQHLVKSTNSHFIVAAPPSSSPSALQTLTSELVQQLKSANHTLHHLSAPSYTELYLRFAKRPIPPFKPDPSFTRLPSVLSLPAFSKAPSLLSKVPNREKDWPGIYIHSSGSTSFPKPIKLSQRLAIFWGNWCWYGDIDFGGKMVGSGFALPPFHSIGISCQTFLPLTSKETTS